MSKGFASNYRVYLLAALVFLAFAGLGTRLVWLHVIDREELLGSLQQVRAEILPDFARRGNIFDRNLNLLAGSVPLNEVGVDPWSVKPADAAKWPALAKLVGLPLPELTKILTTKYRPAVSSSVASGPQPNLVLNLTTEAGTELSEADAQGRRMIRYVKLSEEVPEAANAEIAKLGLHEVVSRRTYRRTYPHHELAAHLVGYVNRNLEPVQGLERYLNFYLRGENGWKESEKDGLARELAQFRSRIVHPADGYDVVLTIDATVQGIAEQELQAIAAKYHPAKATIVISDPRTGYLLAMANYPTFDLNAYNKLTAAQQPVMQNVAVNSIYEPGSVFKIVAIAGALDSGLITPATRYDCTVATALYKGRSGGRSSADSAATWRPRKIPKEDITDHFLHPLTVAEIIAHSSNKGTVQVAFDMGDDLFYRYARAFGFGESSGFPVGGESNYPLGHPGTADWNQRFTRIPMGQSVAVNVLQMHRAMSVIAAGGNLLKPQIIREIRSSTGETVFRYGPAIERRAISAATAHTMARLLWGVVNQGKEGSAPEAKIEGFDVVGKTGTAQKPRTDGVPGYQDHHHVISSFIGFFPADNPQVDITVVVDDADSAATPFGTAYGHVVAAPAFRNIALKVIPYLDIRPNRLEVTHDILAMGGGSR
jgi:cell division protein FtsI/penicillin-binding protein 2